MMSPGSLLERGLPLLFAGSAERRGRGMRRRRGHANVSPRAKLTIAPCLSRRVSLTRERKRETKTEQFARRSAGKPTNLGHAIPEAA
jgi:hypothetical protein